MTKTHTGTHRLKHKNTNTSAVRLYGTYSKRIICFLSNPSLIHHAQVLGLSVSLMHIYALKNLEAKTFLCRWFRNKKQVKHSKKILVTLPATDGEMRCKVHLQYIWTSQMTKKPNGDETTVKNQITIDCKASNSGDDVKALLHVWPIRFICHLITSHSALTWNSHDFAQMWLKKVNAQNVKSSDYMFRLNLV